MAPDPLDSGQAPARASLSDVTLVDFLLALFVGLGITRLASVLAIALLAGFGFIDPGKAPDMQTLIAAVLILQTVGLIGAIYLFAVWRRKLAWSEIGLRRITKG